MSGKYRKNQTRSRPRSRQSSYSLTWVWIFLGIFIGIGSSAGLYMLFTKETTSKPAFRVVKSKEKSLLQKLTKAPVAKASASKSDRDANQRYEFYTLLPGMEIQLPDANAPKPVQAPVLVQKPVAEVANVAARYIIQAGTFPALEQAAALKHRLIQKGFTAHIQKVQTREGRWFRVTLGPFGTESGALAQKKRLEQHKIRSTLILQRPSTV